MANAQQWSMPQISIPGGMMSGGSDSSSFSERLQRKKIARERLAEDKARYNMALKLAADEREYQHSRQANADSMAKGRYGMAVENHQLSKDAHMLNMDAKRTQMAENKLIANDRQILRDEAKVAKDLFSRAPDIIKSVNTESEDAINNEFKRLADSGASQEQIDEVTKKIIGGYNTGSLSSNNITNPSQYAARVTKKLLEQGMKPTDVDKYVNTMIKGAVDDDKANAIALKMEGERVAKLRQDELLADSKKEIAGSVDIAKILKGDTAKEVDSAYMFDVFTGTERNEKTGEIENKGSRVGREEIPTLLQTYANTEFKTGKNSMRKPTEKELQNAYEVAYQEGWLFGLGADNIDADVFKDTLMSQMLANSNKNIRKGEAAINRKSEEAAKKVIEASLSNTPKKKLDRQLGKNLFKQ